MNSSPSHRAWSKSSPSTKTIREKILSECIDNFRSKRKNSIFQRRICGNDEKMDLVDEVIQETLHEYHLRNLDSDEENGLLNDIEFMSELENAIRLEMNNKELEDYVNNLDELDETYGEEAYNTVLCPVCR